MTIEELKNAIDILAGQGNQVDCGGQLKDILQALAMPSKYNVIKALAKQPDDNDMVLKAGLALAEEQDAIFGKVIEFNDLPGRLVYATIVNYVNDANAPERLFSFGFPISGYDYITLGTYSAKQYAALAAIQKYEVEHFGEPLGPLSLTNTGTGGALNETEAGYLVCVNNHPIIPEVNQDKMITGFSLSTSITNNDIEISMEEAEGLIGITLDE